MSKKKLLVIVGAGASVDFGMPSVWKVSQLLAKEAQDRFPLADDPTRNLYSWLVDEVTRYWATAVRPGLSKTPNFEDILYAAFLLSAVYPRGIFTSPLGALVNIKPFLDILWQGVQRRVVDEHVWREFGSFLSDTIISTFREKCRQLEPVNKPKIDEMRMFLQHLSRRLQLAFVTLNYDDIVYRSVPDLTTGFDRDGIFHDELLFGRRRWPCILHLHGSVHFDMRTTSRNLHDIQWGEDLNALFNQNSEGRDSVQSSEGTAFPRSVIVAGQGKTWQILRRPFRTYYSELDRLVSRSDALLCLGYGFGDMHLNMALEAYRDSRRRPVVLIDWAADKAMCASAADCDEPRRPIVHAMKVLMTPRHSMRALGLSVPTTVKDLKDQRAFDLSEDPGCPLAIWYNGMLEACRHPNKVIAQLSQPRWSRKSHIRSVQPGVLSKWR